MSAESARTPSALPGLDGAAPEVPDAAVRLAELAARSAGVRIEGVRSAGASTRVSALLNTIWGPSGADIIDQAFLIALAHSGNLVALATRDGVDVGAAVGFSGPPDAPFHSHIVGVLPGRTGTGVGSALKLHQRAWCLGRGIGRMSWTYDPLVARNAAFNIRRLGALPQQYRQNFYGPMSDAINAGQDSDRMVIGWDLSTEPRVFGGAAEPPVDDAQVALDKAGDRPGRYRRPSASPGAVSLVGVPGDIGVIRQADPVLAGDWRSATAAAFLDLFEHGWQVSGFTGSGHYVLHHGRTP